MQTRATRAQDEEMGQASGSKTLGHMQTKNGSVKRFEKDVLIDGKNQASLRSAPCHGRRSQLPLDGRRPGVIVDSRPARGWCVGGQD